MQGAILGHEGVGIVESGADVRNLRRGDRVVIGSTLSCGFGSYCRAGYWAQCDTSDLAGGTAFFGGPEAAGAYDGMQAEARACALRRDQLRDASRRGHRRPGHHDLRHLPHRREIGWRKVELEPAA